MEKYNLLELAEFGEKHFLPKVLVNQPGYRLVLLNIRSGQSVSESLANQTVTIYAISGRVTIHQDEAPVDLKAGEVLWSESTALQHLEAREDSSLLIVVAGNGSRQEEELDLRAVERFQRHPLVFQTFDSLKVGESFILINDHDPVPLHGQMEAMRPHQLTWEYIVHEPGIFHIRIRRIAPPNGSETPLSTVPQNLWGIQPRR